MLQNKINEMREAARGNATQKVAYDLLTTLKGQLETLAKQGKSARGLKDEDVIGVLKSTLKGVDSNIEIYTKAGRTDAADKAKAEKAILEGLLPAQLSESDLHDFIEPMAREGAPMGQIMGALKAAHGGAYDGKLAAQMAKHLTAA